MTNQSRKLNWRPDLPDQRDHIYAPKKVAVAKLPIIKDLRPLCSPVEDQGQLGSCTGNAIAGAIELLEGKGGKSAADISRLFIYYCEREYINEVSQDSGAYIRDGIKAIRTTGASLEAIWPYDISMFAVKPSTQAYASAANHKFTKYQRIVTLDDMLRCLAAGFPFVFGFTVYTSFMSDAVARTGKVPMPKPGDQVEGGHAVLAVGYSQKSKRFIVRNSWGPDWGNKGYCSMPFAYLADRNLSDDMWTVQG
jgi:C1A family cysteine protease